MHLQPNSYEFAYALPPKTSFPDPISPHTFKLSPDDPNSPTDMSINLYQTINPSNLPRKSRKAFLVSQHSPKKPSKRDSEANFLKTKAIYNNTIKLAPYKEFSSRGSSASGRRFRPVSVEPKAEKDGTVTGVEADLEQGFLDAYHRDYVRGLFNTLIAKKAIEENMKKGTKYKFDTLFVTYYNLAGIQYALNNYDECTLQVQNSLMNYDAWKSCNKTPLQSKNHYYNFSALEDQVEYLEALAKKDVYRKHMCKVHLQACLAYSHMNNSVQAFAHARKAAKMACKLLYHSLLIAYHLYQRLSEIKKSREIAKGEELGVGFMNIIEDLELGQDQGRRSEIIDENNYERENRISTAWLEYLEKVIPILEQMIEKVKGKKATIPTSNKPRLLFMMKNSVEKENFKEIDMRNLYDNLAHDHFLYTSNITSIAMIQPIRTRDLQQQNNISLYDIVEIDSLIEQILLVTTSMYCVSAELRFWSKMKYNKDSPLIQEVYAVLRKESQSDAYRTSRISLVITVNRKLKEASELWVGRTVAFTFVFLPHNSVLAEQIISTHYRMYDPTKLSIPEDEELNYHLKYLIPAKGINRSSRYFIPVIKDDPEDETDGIESLLSLNHELTQSTTNLLYGVKLFNPRSPFFEQLLDNYTKRNLAKKFFLSTNKMINTSQRQSSCNKSLHRISSKSPDLKASFQNMLKAYLGNTPSSPKKFLSNANPLNLSQRVNRSRQKDRHTIDYDSQNEEKPSSLLIKDIVNKSVELPPQSFHKIHPLIPQDFEGTRNTHHLPSRARESTKRQRGNNDMIGRITPTKNREHFLKEKLSASFEVGAGTFAGIGAATATGKGNNMFFGRVLRPESASNQNKDKGIKSLQMPTPKVQEKFKVKPHTSERVKPPVVAEGFIRKIIKKPKRCVGPAQSDENEKGVEGKAVVEEKPLESSNIDGSMVRISLGLKQPEIKNRSSSVRKRISVERMRENLLNRSLRAGSEKG